LNRFIALFPGRRFPRPDELLAMRTSAIRRAGFSRPKIAALRDLAAKTLDGTVPTSRVIRRLDDNAIVERLVEVRGIGRWTVEMLLIFQLGRPDVLPVDDFGVRNGFRIAYGRRSMPTPGAVLRYGERWKPYRTAAAWYLWRAADQAKA
jgi:DNA-3-methyladenine glycosylase II